MLVATNCQNRHLCHTAAAGGEEFRKHSYSYDHFATGVCSGQVVLSVRQLRETQEAVVQFPALLKTDCVSEGTDT